MRGLQQEFKRIPHNIKEGQDPVNGRWWRVTLLPDRGEQIECARGTSITEALSNAEEILRQKFPGATL